MDGTQTHPMQSRVVRKVPPKIPAWKSAAVVLGVLAGLGTVGGGLAKAFFVDIDTYRSDMKAQTEENTANRVFRATMDQRLERLDKATDRLEQATRDLQRHR